MPTREQLLEERLHSVCERVRRELRDYYLEPDAPEHEALRAALAKLEEDRPHIALTVERHVRDGQSFDQLAQAWRVSNRNVAIEFQGALVLLAATLGRLGSGGG